jgi:uncharacterized protein YndB with AHSA1/START domain
MTDRSARATMLIRRPMGEVFDAFVKPDRITRFWLEATSGPLTMGARVTWQFMVPGASESVTVTAFEPPRLIAFDWSDGLHVRLDFEDHSPGVTLVTAAVSGFASDAPVADIVNATEGFSIVLCDLKTLLETGRSANLVRDKAALIAASAGGAER